MRQGITTTTTSRDMFVLIVRAVSFKWRNYKATPYSIAHAARESFGSHKKVWCLQFRQFISVPLLQSKNSGATTGGEFFGDG